MFHAESYIKLDSIANSILKEFDCLGYLVLFAARLLFHTSQSFFRAAYTFLCVLFARFKMAPIRDRGIRIAIDVSGNAYRLPSGTLILILGREEVHSRIVLEIREVERWKMT